MDEENVPFRLHSGEEAETTIGDMSPQFSLGGSSAPLNLTRSILCLSLPTQAQIWPTIQMLKYPGYTMEPSCYRAWVASDMAKEVVKEKEQELLLLLEQEKGFSSNTNA